ncbi:helix-turn-helix transcriptional regulator [Spirosoma pollinicola]|uniref:WYL domain-containing protein n=1 Tax=Spirosoma pollinicola TaxID=2057025 RepID=A0A2K8YWU3_9BACT|nr:WYL domain-containing protein [Spirosoma pollinicola]AUD02097.1 WYL domain-containing protein [Spirosoma pollinicola]
MNDSAKLRRQLHLIRCLDKPYTYPSLIQVHKYLLDHDIEQTSLATVERDINDIRTDYDISIIYDRRRHGYFLDLPTDDEDISNFREFVRLLERRERLELLTRSGRSVAQYIQLEQHNGFRGLDLMAPLWNALQRKLVITFSYQAYKDKPAEKRWVEPGLLFEYRNRWYLDGFDLDRNGERTFGLDRIIDLTLTPQSILPSRQTDYRAARRHVIGVTAPPGSSIEHVILRFRRPEAEYILSLPLHNSQQTLAETPTYVDIEIQVVLNHELEREILAYGEEVEVLAPACLRETMARRYSNVMKHYDS